MTERIRSSTSSTTTTGYQFSNTNKMENELSPRKTMLVLVIVVGCFAVLWPKVFYPMLVGTVNQHIKPSPIDKMTGCCDVISETDINTIKIMSELCGTIIKSKEDKDQKRLNNREIVQICRQEVLETCGIDIAAVLQEQIRLGQNTKQILDEVRSLNGSLCLKYNYGIAPWRLGVPHRITIKNDNNIRQERPHHLRSELIHPAFRERGRAIPPQPQQSPKSSTRPPPRIVEGRPGPIPGMRPTIGGAGHVVPPSKQSTSSMSVIMPIYTIGIVIFFTYTLMKIIFKKQPEGVGGGLYPPIVPDPHFRKEVFESDRSRLQSRVSNGRESNKSSKLVVNAMSALLDEVDQEIEARRKSNDIAAQDLANGSLSNGDALKPHENNVADDQPTVKVLGMEMRASCEGGKKWSRPSSPILPTTTPQPPSEPVPPPQEIYLEGALPAQSHLLVSDSATEPQPSDSSEDPAVVLAGKMTLSVISLDSSENGGGNKSDEERQKLCEEIDEEIKNLEKVAGTESQTSSVPQEPESVAKEFEIIEELKDPIVDVIESVNAEITPEVLESEVLESRQEVQIDKGSNEQIPPGVTELELESETLVKQSEAIEEPILEAQKESSDTKEILQSELEQTVPKETKITETPVLGTQIIEIKQPEETVEETKTETIQEAAVEAESIQFQVEPSVKEHIDENIEKEVDDLINEAVEQVKTIQDLKTTAEIEEIVEKTSRESSEIGSNEEIEIEEVVYTSDDEDVEEEEEEEIEVEVDEEEEEEGETRQETHEHKRFNGDTGAEESKHTTTTSHTVAENEVSEGTDNEEVEDEEEEIIEIVDDDEEEQADVGLNHIAGGSGEED